MHIVWFLLIGILAGFLAGKLTTGRGFGLVGDLIVGVVGAFLGGFLFRLLGIATENLLGALVCATVGAVVLVLAIRAIKKT